MISLSVQTMKLCSHIEFLKSYSLYFIYKIPPPFQEFGMQIEFQVADEALHHGLSSVPSMKVLSSLHPLL